MSRWADHTCTELAQIVAEVCRELNVREYEHRKDLLVAASEVWPSLYDALRAKGKELGLNNSRRLIMPEWATEPVVPTAGHYGKKPKTKAEAMEIAIKFGDGAWATLGELWLWVANTGPIITRTLAKYEYVKQKSNSP